MSYGNYNAYEGKNYYPKKRSNGGSFQKNNDFRKPQKPTSGCKVFKNRKTASGETKEIVATGWLKTRNGLISYVGSPASAKYQKDNGNIKLVFKVTQGVSHGLYWGTYNTSTNQIYIQGMNIIGMPSRKSSFFRKG